MNNVTFDEAQEMIKNGVLVIDVRTPAEFAEGHIPGAYNIDIHALDFTERIKAFDPEATYIINCQSGGRSARATSLMHELGFTKAVNLTGGITAWKAAGLPVER